MKAMLTIFENYPRALVTACSHLTKATVTLASTQLPAYWEALPNRCPLLAGAVSVPRACTLKSHLPKLEPYLKKASLFHKNKKLKS
jgi:hypothetical protein